MSDVWGSNPAQLRELAQLCSQGSATITAASTAISSAVNNPFMWQGRDADRVRQQWNGSMRLQILEATNALEKVSAELLGHADEQETASDEGGGAGGNPTRSAPGTAPGTAPSGDDSPNAWDIYNTLKAIPNMRAGLYDIATLLHRGGPFDKAAFAALRNSDALSGIFNTSSDLFDGKWHTALGLAEGTKAFAAFDVLGKSLGVLGTGLDVWDAVDSYQQGDYGDAVYSTAKAVLGGLSFAPPPVGTAAMVASGALALYDNVPIIHDSVNAVGTAIGEGVADAADAVGDAADAVGDTLSDGAEAVGDFFGF